VIAEATGYGCIPLTADISCISQYIKTGFNGYLFKSNNVQEIIQGLAFLTAQKSVFKELASNALRIPEPFTYEHFLVRVKNEIIKEVYE